MKAARMTGVHRNRAARIYWAIRQQTIQDRAQCVPRRGAVAIFGILPRRGRALRASRQATAHHLLTKKEGALLQAIVPWTLAAEFLGACPCWGEMAMGEEWEDDRGRIILHRNDGYAGTVSRMMRADQGGLRHARALL